MDQSLSPHTARLSMTARRSYNHLGSASVSVDEIRQRTAKARKSDEAFHEAMKGQRFKSRRFQLWNNSQRKAVGRG